MKLLILCAVFSAILAVSLAGTVRGKKCDVNDSFDGSENCELKNFKENSFSSEEDDNEETKIQKYKVKDNSEEEEDKFRDTSEEQSDTNVAIEDEINENSSLEELIEKRQENYFKEIFDDRKIENTNSAVGRTKRALNFAPHTNNQLNVKDENSTKYNKYLKLKILKRALESDESTDSRLAGSAGTSEEKSSEETTMAKGYHKKPAAATAEGVAPIETLKLAEAGAKVYRRRRNADDSSEEDQFAQGHDMNEVFILSNEYDRDSMENLQATEQMILNVNVFKKLKNSLEIKDSEEDYAQGCGGSNGDLDDDSNENFNEDNDARK